MNSDSYTQQLLTYLECADISKGIVLALDTSKEFDAMKIEERLIESKNSEYIIRVIHN